MENTRASRAQAAKNAGQVTSIQRRAVRDFCRSRLGIFSTSCGAVVAPCVGRLHGRSGNLYLTAHVQAFLIGIFRHHGIGALQDINRCHSAGKYC